MSSGSELQELWNELPPDMPESFRVELARKMARLFGLKILDGNTSFQKDMARLDEKNRAIYRMQGLPMEEGDQSRITNILGDNCTITLDADDGELPNVEQPADKQPQKPVDPPKKKPDQPQRPVQPPPVQDTGKMPGWAKVAVGTLLGAAVSVGPTAYFLRPAPSQPQPGGSIFRFDTELPPWMQDDAQQTD